MGHRQFLDSTHRFRRNRVAFDGEIELREAPISLSGTELLDQMCGIKIIFGTMQQLIPIAVRGVLPKNVSAALIELISFFVELCSKVGTVEKFKQLEPHIAIRFCHLEMIFPPAFFDIIVHLTIRLAGVARVAGPVHFRWMYPIEWYLLTVKSYVRYRSRPEGSIAGGYLAEECLTFCSRYLHDVETKSNRAMRNYDVGGIGLHQGLFIFSRPGRVLEKEESMSLPHDTWLQMHNCVLFNCLEVSPFVK